MWALVETRLRESETGQARGLRQQIAVHRRWTRGRAPTRRALPLSRSRVGGYRCMDRQPEERWSAHTRPAQGKKWLPASLPESRISLLNYAVCGEFNDGRGGDSSKTPSL